MGFRGSGLRFKSRVKGLGFRVQSLGLKVQTRSLEFRAKQVSGVPE